MTGETAIDPRRLERADAASFNALAASWTRAFFAHQSWVAAALAASGAIATASVIPLRHWPTGSLVLLLVASSVAAVNSGLRIAIGKRLPRSSLQLDVAFGNLFVTVAVLASASEHVDLANLYLLVEMFALLYLPLRAALAHLAAAGAAYALVLGLGPRPAEPPLVAWLAVFGTAVVLGAVIVGLVSVLRAAARDDPLTGLANRRSWDERLAEEIERSRRSGHALSVVVIDVDGFKSVNDTGGHDAGDRLLRELAASWKDTIRAGDFLARLGGDEFGLLAPGSDTLGVHGLVARLLAALPAGISASVGAATWNGDEAPSDLVRRADRVMYQNKRRHRRAEGLHGA